MVGSSSAVAGGEISDVLGRDGDDSGDAGEVIADGI